MPPSSPRWSCWTAAETYPRRTCQLRRQFSSRSSPARAAGKLRPQFSSRSTLPDCRRDLPPPELPASAAVQLPEYTRRSSRKASAAVQLPEYTAGAAGLPAAGRLQWGELGGSRVNMDFRVKAKVPFPQFFSTVSEISPIASLYLLWKYQRRQTQSL